MRRHCRGKVSDVLEALGKRNEIKGEVTIVVEGASAEIGETDPESIDRMLVQHKKIGSSLKDAVKMVSEESGYSKSKTYKRALQYGGGNKNKLSFQMSFTSLSYLMLFHYLVLLHF